ncbi:5-hydroxytryptamine receptor [Nucella lapillus]
MLATATPLITMTTAASSAPFPYNVSEGLSLLQAYIFNVSNSSHTASPHNGSEGADFQSLEVTTDVVEEGEENRSSLGPPFGLTVYSQEHLISTSVVLGIMILCCIIGNCFVIAAVILERSLHNVANYLILSLAVADLMVAVLVMPLSVVAEISRVWFLHSEVCDMWISFDVLCCTASILHLVAIAMDRYWAVTSIDYMRRRSARRILLMILAVWIVALTISIPPLFGWRDPNNDPDSTGVCLISQDHGYTIFSTVGAFYLPMFIMICIYTRIFMVARRRIRKDKFHKKKKRNGATTAGTRTVAAENINMTVQPEYSVVSNCNGCTLEKEKDKHAHSSRNGMTTPSQEEKNNSQADLSGDNDSHGVPAGNGKTGGYTNGIEQDPPTMNLDKSIAGTPDGTRKPCLPSSRQREKLEQKRERKAARTLAIITGAFLLCWLPFFIVALTGPFIRSSVVIPPAVDSLLLWLGYLNSLLNPIIYTIFSPEFRNAFRKILFGKYSRRSAMRGR